MAKSISVLGAAGQMGRAMCKYFVAAKFDVTGYDEDESLPLPKSVRRGSSLVAAILEADYVLLCTPTRKTPEVIRLLSKEMKRDACLIEISSQKAKTAPAISRVPSKIHPVCIHPMFGPSFSNAKGQNIIIVPVRDAKRELAVARSLFPGANFVTVDAAEHDKRIAVILGITHLVNLTFASIVSKDEKPSLTYKMSGATFRIQKTLSDYIMSESADLIETILSNPQMRRTAEDLWKDIGRLLTSIQDGKSEEVIEYVKACQARIEASGDAAASAKRIRALSRAAG